MFLLSFLALSSMVLLSRALPTTLEATRYYDKSNNVDGLVKEYDNSTVTSNCGLNEEWLTAEQMAALIAVGRGRDCQNRCYQPVRTCTRLPVKPEGQCHCLPEYFRNDGVCVPDCKPVVVCPVYDHPICLTVCDPNCGEKNPYENPICKRVCIEHACDCRRSTIYKREVICPAKKKCPGGQESFKVGEPFYYIESPTDYPTQVRLH